MQFRAHVRARAGARAPSLANERQKRTYAHTEPAHELRNILRNFRTNASHSLTRYERRTWYDYKSLWLNATARGNQGAVNEIVEETAALKSAERAGATTTGTVSAVSAAAPLDCCCSGITTCCRSARVTLCAATGASL